MKLRINLRTKIRHQVGDGGDTFLWLDSWHPLGPLCDKSNERIICITGLPIDAKVKDVIRNGTWSWPNPFDMEVAEFLNNMPPYLRDSSRNDMVLWTADRSGVFSSKSAYGIFREPHAAVEWFSLVWGPWSIPSHSFILWLAIRNRLSTLDRIVNFLHIPAACILCPNGRECHDHLFFDYPFSSVVWRHMCHRAGCRWPQSNWNSNVLWVTKRWKGKNLKAFSFRLTLAGSVYFI